jgi:hypothetical protein
MLVKATAQISAARINRMGQLVTNVTKTIWSIELQMSQIAFDSSEAANGGKKISRVWYEVCSEFIRSVSNDWWRPPRGSWAVCGASREVTTIAQAALNEYHHCHQLNIIFLV